MKVTMALPLFLFAACLLLAPQSCAGIEMSPITKTVELLSSLEAKLIADGEKTQKTYEEYSEWCEDRSKNLGFEIKTETAEVESLKAAIQEETATISELTTKVEELTGGIAKDDADLKAAVAVRHDEAADFAAEEKESKEIISTLERAIGFVSKKMGSASMMQLKDARSITDALGVMVQAAVFNTADASRLTALVQSSQGQESEDSDMGAPEAAVYKEHTGGIVETLEDLLDKAQGQLDSATKKETTAVYNFEMLKGSLEDQIKFATKELDGAKKGIASATEKKATAEGELEATSKDLAEDIKVKAALHASCMGKAADFEAEVKSRDEELSALASAKKAITETTGASESIVYGLTQESFLQLTRAETRLTSGVDLAHFEAVRFVRDLARKQHSTALAQLAKRMASAVRYGARVGQDPFSKVKGLISDLISKLEADAETDASHKAYCDKELSESHTKREDKTSEIEKLSTKIDQMSAKSSQLKAEAASLQKDLAALAAAQAEMDKLRSEEKATYTTTKADLEEGLSGVKTALKVLRDYYDTSASHETGAGEATGIIGLLEVVESDLSKALTETVATEENAVAAYETETKENEISKASKEQDVKYKSEEATSLDKAVAEATSDRSGVQAELDAVNEYLSKLEGMCIEKAEPFAERKARREAEIAGLKQALDILAGEAVLLQRRTSRDLLRRHHA
jgi:peptidoglycan hydrolase CwlO-like protein